MGPFASLNLAAESGDEPQAVRENLRRVEGEFNRGGGLVTMRQVHGTAVAVVGSEHSPPSPTADAVLTTAPGTALVVRVADCVPVLLGDVQHGVVCAVHAGRLGLVAGVVPAAVAAMREVGARHLVAWLGPHICGRCYEVPERLRAEVCAVVPQAFAETSWGTPSVDLGMGVSAQLSAAEVEVVDASRCTREHDDLYSYRRDGVDAGRFAGLVRLAP